MAETLSGNVSSISRFLHQNGAGLSITYSGNPVRDYERSFTSSDVTLIFFGNYTVTTTPTDIDLTSLTDAYGNAVNFATVKHLQIVNNDTSHDLTVGGGTNALFAALPVLVGQTSTTSSDGSCLNLTTNITVDGTHKILELTASAGSISVDVFVVGS
jgi:hypothetical protein